MKKKSNQLSEMASLQALGALAAEDAHAFASLLGQNAQARQEALAFGAVAEGLAKALPLPQPSPELKERILHAAEKARARQRAGEAMAKMVPSAQNGLAYLKSAASGAWVPLPVQGAFVKLLSFDAASDYAVVLGKLDPGSRYPGHQHKCPEDIFMISGDLHVGEEVLQAGDFHHAEAGSTHPVNWSEHGCVLICVLSKEDLINQLG